MAQNTGPCFAPELHIPKGTTSIDFYLDFGAKEHFCFRNEDGSIHVVELDFDGAIFHLHETMRDALEPVSAKGVTSVVGLFVEDVQEVFDRAIAAGAIVVDPVTDHDYGYRQGMTMDTGRVCSGTHSGIYGRFKNESIIPRDFSRRVVESCHLETAGFADSKSGGNAGEGAACA